jgi:hypothetical protein
MSWMPNERRKTQGVQNVEPRSTSTAMASPNHSSVATVLNKTRWVIKTNKAILVRSLTNWKELHRRLWYKRNVGYIKAPSVTGVQATRRIKCQMEKHPRIKHPRQRRSTSRWGSSNRNWTSRSGRSTTITSSTTGRYSANFSGCSAKQFSELWLVVPQCLQGSLDALVLWEATNTLRLRHRRRQGLKACLFIK